MVVVVVEVVGVDAADVVVVELGVLRFAVVGDDDVVVVAVEVAVDAEVVAGGA